MQNKWAHNTSIEKKVRNFIGKQKIFPEKEIQQSNYFFRCCNVGDELYFNKQNRWCNVIFLLKKNHTHTQNFVNKNRTMIVMMEKPLNRKKRRRRSKKRIQNGNDIIFGGFDDDDDDIYLFSFIQFMVESTRPKLKIILLFFYFDLNSKTNDDGNIAKYGVFNVLRLLRMLIFCGFFSIRFWKKIWNNQKQPKFFLIQKILVLGKITTNNDWHLVLIDEKQNTHTHTHQTHARWPPEWFFW